MMGEQGQAGWRWQNGAAGSALAVGIGLLCLPFGWGGWLADWSYDLPFLLRPTIAAPGVVVIYMDEESAKTLGQPFETGTWDRMEHARLVRRLADYGARAVVFDLLFDTPSTNDAALVDAFRAARAAGTEMLVGGKLEVTPRPGQGIERRLLSPLPTIEQAAVWGLAETGDGTVSRRLHVQGDADFGIPSLAWRVAERIAPQALPDPGEPRWVNYYGPPGTLTHRRFRDVLDTSLDLSVVVSNHVCFVGGKPGTPYAGGLRADEWETPYSWGGSDKMPGVELIATVYLNLVQQQWLKRLSGVEEVLVVVMTGTILGLGLGLCRPTWAVGLGIATAGLVWVAACWLMWGPRYWFSWLTVAGVQMPTAVVWSVLVSFKRMARNKDFLERRLALLTQSAPQAPPVAAPEAATRAMEAADGPAKDATHVMPSIPDHQLVRRVGKGAYGEVWLARNDIGTYHVVKIIRKEDFEHLDPFEREFRGLQKFMPISRSHPGLVQVLHVGRHDAEGFFYYVMEAADDEETGQEIDPANYAPLTLSRAIRKNGCLPLRDCLRLGLDLTSALAFLHQRKLIHRDIKPANVIFVNGVAKLADIGLVTDMAATGRDVTFLGTEGYIPPEGPGTPAGDLYSLGKVLYEASMGLGRSQFPELPASLMERPDSAGLLQLNEIMLKACEADIALRYHSANEMHADLLALQQRL